mgnify:CR=1 FL=1
MPANNPAANDSATQRKDAETSTKLETLLRQVLTLLGENIDREGLKQTPKRWADSLLDYTRGVYEDPGKHLKTIFHLTDSTSQDFHDVVIMDNIEFTSTCEAHMAPMQGIVHVAYIPSNLTKAITGLSKLSRVVDVFAHRLQVQERLIKQISSTIDEHLDTLGTMVIAQTNQYCVDVNGTAIHENPKITWEAMGMFLETPELQTKVWSCLKLSTANIR